MSVAKFDPLSKQLDTIREEIISSFRDRTAPAVGCPRSASALHEIAFLTTSAAS